MIRLAEITDEDALKSIAGQAMPGKISFAFRYEPSFFKAVQVHGSAVRVLASGKSDEVGGIAVVSTKDVYINGEPAAVGYLCGLRIAPSCRNGLLLARGYRMIRNMQEKDLRLPLFLTAVMKENVEAIKFLTSGRCELPTYSELGLYRTCIFPVFRKRVRKKSPVDIRSGLDTGPGIIAECLKEYGRERQFFPCEVPTGSGRSQDEVYPGVGDFLVAFINDKPVGVVALWNQQPFRQIVVSEYSPLMNTAGKISRIISRLAGSPQLPTINDKLNTFYLSRIAVQNGDKKVFKCLLTEALNKCRTDGAGFLAAGFFNNDPFKGVADSFFHLTLSSIIYKVRWDDSSIDDIPLDGRVPYVELGSL